MYHCTRVATGYGAALTCVKSQKQPAPAEPLPPADANKSPAPSTPLSPQESAGSAELRAALDGERDAILACGGGSVVGMKAMVQPDHSLEIHLTGNLAGTPQEACVRHLLISLKLPNVSPGTLVIHVVR
jgi:hypothetical protein